MIQHYSKAAITLETTSESKGLNNRVASFRNKSKDLFDGMLSGVQLFAKPKLVVTMDEARQLANELRRRGVSVVLADFGDAFSGGEEKLFPFTETALKLSSSLVLDCLRHIRLVDAIYIDIGQKQKLNEFKLFVKKFGSPNETNVAQLLDVAVVKSYSQHKKEIPLVSCSPSTKPNLKLHGVVQVPLLHLAGAGCGFVVFGYRTASVSIGNGNCCQILHGAVYATTLKTSLLNRSVAKSVPQGSMQSGRKIKRNILKVIILFLN